MVDAVGWQPILELPYTYYVHTWDAEVSWYPVPVEEEWSSIVPSVVWHKTWIDAGIHGGIWELPTYAGKLAVVRLVVHAVVGWQTQPVFHIWIPSVLCCTMHIVVAN
jgi:hypothetical protein